MRNALKPLMALTLLPLVAACGGGGGTADTVPTDADVVVKATNSITFDQSEYTASAGEVLFAYQNDSSIRHTLIVVKDGEKVPDFKLIVNKKGEVDSGPVTLEAGNYTVICDVPGHSNMKATLTIK
jgi:plastocyanin